MNIFQDKKILLVGAGGIGCEIIKNLIQANLQKITIVDMDSIELTNLNRQYFYKQKNIGEYKAKILADFSQKNKVAKDVNFFNESIFESKFNLEFYVQFDAVIMALDNIDARNHVNKMCYLSKVFCVDAGTNGMQGQCGIILPGQTKCYQCQPKQKSKNYQFCTIRTLPTEIVHCLLWAKIVFEQLIGKNQENKIIEPIKEINDKQNKDVYRYILDQLFNEQIKEFKKAKINSEYIKEIDFNSEDISIIPKQIFQECEEVFQELFFNQNIPESFDKDNALHIKFVNYFGNLRAFNFGIDFSNEVQTWKLIGNIIPAINSTNSFFAGSVIYELEKGFQNKKDQHLPFIQTFMQLGSQFWIFSLDLESPNSNCQICSKKIIYTNEENLEINQIVQNIKKQINQEIASIEIFQNENLIFELENEEEIQDQQKLFRKVQETFLINNSLSQIIVNDTQMIYLCICSEKTKRQIKSNQKSLKEKYQKHQDISLLLKKNFKLKKLLYPVKQSKINIQMSIENSVVNESQLWSSDKKKID